MIVDNVVLEVDMREIGHFVRCELFDTFFHNVCNMWQDAEDDNSVITLDQVEQEADRLERLFETHPMGFEL